MNYLSVCSGIEAATAAWHPLGWSPVGFSEIEKFPSAVLDHHYPETPNFGDMTLYDRWPETAVDVLVGGTPCQSFSVAGLRKGMADPRGNLALVYLAIADRYRPDWLVWENVPGVLSSNDGRDFGAFLGALVKLGYGFAYRVLDAQYFGVAQRRRRVFVVANARSWTRAAAVLFESESMSGNPAPRRESRESAAYDVAPSLTASGRGTERAGESRGQDCVIPSIAGTIDASDGKKWGSNQWVDTDKAVVQQSVANPLTARMQKGVNSNLCEGQTPIVVHGSQDPCFGEKAFPLGRNHGAENAVAYAQNQRDEVRELKVAGALGAIRRGDAKNETVLQQGMAVRRLTPTECERLQGFPDDYTNIPGASDSARYKALGNSMAVPVMNWIGRRMKDAA